MTQLVDQVLSSARADLIEVSHSIHAEPELAFMEFKSAAKTIALLQERGFAIEQGTAKLAGLPTAFRASFGSGDLVIGICAEYDALPDMGHACGHNIIAAAAVGAGLALAEYADELDLTVVVLGTPAEESGGGKVLMLEHGAFDDIAAALMVHPGPADVVDARSLALADIAIRYEGRQSHASAAPEYGINAADAATIAQVSLGLLRQHLGRGQQLHGIISAGGEAPNIIPGHSELLYYLRALDSDSLEALRLRVSDCFAAGALATGCTHEIRSVAPTYRELASDSWLLSAYQAGIIGLGRQPISVSSSGQSTFGSTDMGNVTQVLPGIHPLIGIDSAGATIHQPDFMTAAASSSADQAIIDGATAMAGTVIRAALDNDQRNRLLLGVAERVRKRKK